MPRQSALIWTALAGILFLTGLLLNHFSNQTGHIQLRLESWENSIYSSGGEVSSLSYRLDSLRILPGASDYELQVRQATGEFNEQIHPGVLRPSTLVNAYSLEPMKIRKIGATPFRFRLQEFYPDFYFQYTYPESQDTIAPKAPGITLLLKTPGGEELVTLRADQPNMNKLGDVIQLESSLEFYWNYVEDGLSMSNHDTTRTIIFSGEDKKIHFLFNAKTTSLPLELNHFYAIPGKDTIGFTVLQCFPDIAYLTAQPASRSKELNNPVAGIEVWKLEGRSQEVFLYPISSAKTGGTWDVPGSDLLLRLAISHHDVARDCQCAVSVADSSRHINKQIVLKGNREVSVAGNRIKLIECDPNGFSAAIRVRKATGHWLMIAGAIGVIASLMIHFVIRKQLKNNTRTGQISS